MNLLSSEEKGNVLKTFPTFVKLSYEMMSHKKVLTNEYDICVAIPQGKRIYLWFTSIENKPSVYAMELSLKENTFGNIWLLPWKYSLSLAYGTILTGYFLEETTSFVIDDIFQYKGLFLYVKEFAFPFFKKLPYLEECLQEICQENKNDFYCIVMWKNTEKELSPEDIVTGYTVRYIQYRNSMKIVPYQNKMFQMMLLPTDIIFISIINLEFQFYYELQIKLKILPIQKLS
jgi:hypothetical protein